MRSSSSTFLQSSAAAACLNALRSSAVTRKLSGLVRSVGTLAAAGFTGVFDFAGFAGAWAFAAFPGVGAFAAFAGAWTFTGFGVLAAAAAFAGSFAFTGFAGSGFASDAAGFAARGAAPAAPPGGLPLGG